MPGKKDNSVNPRSTHTPKVKQIRNKSSCEPGLRRKRLAMAIVVGNNEVWAVWKCCLEVLSGSAVWKCCLEVLSETVMLLIKSS
jgi:hypothetical protein